MAASDLEGEHQRRGHEQRQQSNRDRGHLPPPEVPRPVALPKEALHHLRASGQWKDHDSHVHPEVVAEPRFGFHQLLRHDFSRDYSEDPGTILSVPEEHPGISFDSKAVRQVAGDVLRRNQLARRRQVRNSNRDSFSETAGSLERLLAERDKPLGLP